MKILFSLLFFFLFMDTHTPQGVIIAKPVEDTLRAELTKIPDTTIYETPVESKLGLEVQLEKMEKLRRESKKVYDTSIKLQRKAEVKKALEFFDEEIVHMPR